jgi:hypothetical protein
MREIFPILSGEQVVGLAWILSGLLIVLGAIGMTQLRWVREAKLRAELMREMLQRGLKVEEIERLLQQAPGGRSRAAGLNDPGVEGEIAVELARQVSDPAAMEDALRAVRSADIATKRAVLDAVHEMADNESDQRVIVAAVQSLCARAAERHQEFRDEAPLKQV